MTDIFKSFKRRLLVLAVVCTAAAASCLSVASAQTVNDIKAKGKLVVGVLVDFPPFGFYDENKKPIGYDPSLARMIADKMGVELEIVPVLGANRVPYLLSNKVDILVAALGMTPERAKQVDFSEPSAVVEQILYARKELDMKSVDDLKGKRIGVSRGSAQDITLTKVAPEGTIIQRFEEDPLVLQALLSGQVDAISMSTLIIADTQKVADVSNFEIKFPVQRLVHGIAVRKGQTDLLSWINDFLATAKSNGELNALHRKWVGVDYVEVEKPKLD